jgi:hypothetical protein
MAQLVEQKTGKTRKPAGPLPVDGFTSSADDDMSPQSAPYTTNGEAFSDREIRTHEVAQNPNESAPAVESRRTPYRTASQVPQPRVTSDVSEEISTNSGTSESPYPQESAWDRIRRKSASGQPQTSAPGISVNRKQTERQGAMVGDSFAFSSTDEERQLAKEEAQKDFDARVERERQGRNFEEGIAKKSW